MKGSLLALLMFGILLVASCSQTPKPADAAKDSIAKQDTAKVVKADSSKLVKK